MGEGGRNSRRQGYLGRRSSPGTWLFPRSLPPARAPRPLFSPSGNTPNTLATRRRKRLEGPGLGGGRGAMRRGGRLPSPTRGEERQDSDPAPPRSTDQRLATKAALGPTQTRPASGSCLARQEEVRAGGAVCGGGGYPPPPFARPSPRSDARGAGRGRGGARRHPGAPAAARGPRDGGRAAGGARPGLAERRRLHRHQPEVRHDVGPTDSAQPPDARGPGLRRNFLRGAVPRVLRDAGHPLGRRPGGAPARLQDPLLVRALPKGGALHRGGEGSDRRGGLLLQVLRGENVRDAPRGAEA